jgi:hypothetical protein
LSAMSRQTWRRRSHFSRQKAWWTNPTMAHLPVASSAFAFCNERSRRTSRPDDDFTDLSGASMHVQQLPFNIRRE